MGTTGSGHLTDYPGGRDQGAGGEDRCDQAFSVTLEDVERSEFYANNGGVPDPGTPLSIDHDKRIVAKAEDGTTVGNVPTEMNYLAGCLRVGYTYSGSVTDSSTFPMATVSADFVPTSTT